MQALTGTVAPPPLPLQGKAKMALPRPPGCSTCGERTWWTAARVSTSAPVCLPAALGLASGPL